jgi:hypothetical protein
MPDDGAYPAGAATLRRIVDAWPEDRRVVPGRMFTGEGVKVDGRLFAFVGRAGDLMATLPEHRVRGLIGAGAGQPVVMGTRTMREWVRVARGADDGAWSGIIEEAYAFVEGAAPRP